MFGVHTTCADCTKPDSCGDGRCDVSAMENCSSCPDDCGACGASCGAASFGVACGDAFCPAHASCQGGDCVCNSGFTSVRR